MGVELGPLLGKREISLKDLSGKVVAIDAHNALYQFLSIIRQPDGTPLMDSRGRITSHLSGLFYRTTNLIEEGIKPVFVFDGKPPGRKEMTIEERRRMRDEAERMWMEALKRGDKDAFKYAQASARIDAGIVNDAKDLLDAMGIPWIQAPSEGEAQAAHIVRRGDAFCVSSQDYDSLLFGAPVLVRNLNITGKRKLPGRMEYVDISPEIVELESELSSLGITREQLIDIAILIGTDFNAGIKGIGPKKALKLIKEHGSIENVIQKLGAEIEDWEIVKQFFLDPEVSDEYRIEWREPDRSRIHSILCDEHDFSEDRVGKACDRLISAYKASKQGTLDRWF